MIHVYLMPGMAANPSIFEHIKLPEEKFVLHPLSWKIPETAESLSDYAKRMLEEVTEKNPVLLGVSFGGVVVQEMAKQIEFRKLIIVSSVKSKSELPKRMRFSAALGLYRLAPVSLARNIDTLANYAVGDRFKHKVALYQKYLSIRYINNCIPVPGGTHAMIITKCKWFNKNLPKIIEN